MIRRNTASQVIYLPCLKLTVDGSAVTSAATLTVSKDGTESASAGTLAHSAGGVWKYTPTQNETDAAIVALILTATGADPVVVNCVTTASDTSVAGSTAAALAAAKVVLDKSATILYGTVTGAGTATEIFTGAGYTATITVDASGNRSAVVFT